jgi:IS5 family transposase
LSARSDGAVSWPGRADAELRLSDDRVAMPGVPREETMHPRSGSQDRGELAQTPAYKQSRRERNKVEALFSELKQRVGLRQVRLRRLWNVAEQFYLAATAQNLKRLASWLAQRERAPTLCTA